MAALAHGCTIITTHPQMDMPELITNRHARLVPPDSPTLLCIAIEDLADNADLRAELGQNACELGQQFGWDSIAMRSSTFFEELRYR